MDLHSSFLTEFCLKISYVFLYLVQDHYRMQYTDICPIPFRIYFTLQILLLPSSFNFLYNLYMFSISLPGLHLPRNYDDHPFISVHFHFMSFNIYIPLISCTVFETAWEANPNWQRSVPPCAAGFWSQCSQIVHSIALKMYTSTSCKTPGSMGLEFNNGIKNVNAVPRKSYLIYPFTSM